MSYRNYARLYQTCNGTLAADTSSQRYIVPSSVIYDKPSPTPDPNDERNAGVVFLDTSLPSDRLDWRLVNYKEGYKSPSESSTCSGGDNKDYRLIEYAKESHPTGSCSLDDEGKSVCGGGNLYPILDPRFNLRECAKQLILLEDHLFHQGKRCKDCILKHLLTIEGFLEEAITLDKDQEYTSQINESIHQFRRIFKEISAKLKQGSLKDDDCCALAQELRKIRKPLCQNYACFIR
jgi:hypothetical protein